MKQKQSAPEIKGAPAGGSDAGAGTTPAAHHRISSQRVPTPRMSGRADNSEPINADISRFLISLIFSISAFVRLSIIM